jgi:hypothetical protein
MDERFTFWYVSIVEVQLGLEGKEFHKNVLLEGHISHSGRLMCGESMEILLNRVKKSYEAQTVKGLPFNVRQGKTKICPICTSKYMKNGDSAYNAWVEGRALKVTSIEKPTPFSVPENTL